MEINELIRLILNLVRKGTIAEVDHKAAMCRVDSGTLRTNWIRWMALAAGGTRDWNPPTVGEQVLLLCPGGDPADALALSGIFSDQAPAPSTNPNTHTRAYPDGAVIEYDHDTHHLVARLPAAALVRLIAQAQVNVTTAAMNVTGSVNAGGNLTAGTGATGSFTTPTGQIVTVMSGIITNIF